MTVDDDDKCAFDFINDLLSYYENEYKINFENLSNLQPISEDDDNYSFSSIQNYYSEYYSGQTLYDYREYMEQLVEKRCPICDCSFAYSQVTLDHILPKSKFKGVLPLILFISIYELKNSYLELIDFRGVFQSEQMVFNFRPEGKYSELINSHKSFNVNESLLLSIVKPENKAGTEIVIPLSNGNFCILLIEGSFDINTSQIEELDATINKILKL